MPVDEERSMDVMQANGRDKLAAQHDAVQLATSVRLCFIELLDCFLLVL